jgi:hypothetical protein
MQLTYRGTRYEHQLQAILTDLIPWTGQYRGVATEKNATNQIMTTVAKGIWMKYRGVQLQSVLVLNLNPLNRSELPDAHLGTGRARGFSSNC